MSHSRDIRMAALRLSLLSGRERDIFLSGVSPGEAGVLRQLLNELERTGLSRHRKQLSEFFTLQEKSNVAAVAGLPDELALSHMDPFWKMIAMTFMTPEQQEKIRHDVIGESPAVYWQLAGYLGGRKFPEAWRDVLLSTAVMSGSRQ